MKDRIYPLYKAGLGAKGFNIVFLLLGYLISNPYLATIFKREIYQVDVVTRR
jgi:hypothetical protein